MKTYRLMTILLITLVLSVSNAYALNFGTNITIKDKDGSGSGWYGVQEDQEVTPNCITGQVWDLEGFFLKDNRWLTVVGGYNFKNGQDGWKSGDIFIDTTGDAKYGAGTAGGYGGSTVPNSFGYDYVIVLDWAQNESQWYAIDSNSNVKTVYYNQNQTANPWQYALQMVYSDPITYYSGLSDSDVGGFLGGTHYAFTVDLGVLPAGDYTFHYTYQCGNDNLMGYTQIPQVPEPTSLLLLGLGLVGLAGIRRKFKS